MFVPIEQIMVCSQCGTRNNYENVWRGNRNMLRCLVCGHERVVQTLMTNTAGDTWELDTSKPTVVEI